MQHESIRRYHKSIPPYLINRPHPMIEHALPRIERAKHADLTGLVRTGDGKFLVTSFREETGTETYEVSYGDEEEMPHCSCNDWRNSAYLCKHFYAVFKKYPEWGWDKVSCLYTSSPFMTLDPSVIPDASSISRTPVTDPSSDSMPVPSPIFNPVLATQNVKLYCVCKMPFAEDDDDPDM